MCAGRLISFRAINKFTDDAIVVGQIMGGDESVYRRVIKHVVEWCRGKNPSLKVNKTKELIDDRPCTSFH